MINEGDLRDMGESWQKRDGVVDANVDEIWFPSKYISDKLVNDLLMKP